MKKNIGVLQNNYILIIISLIVAAFIVGQLPVYAASIGEIAFSSNYGGGQYDYFNDVKATEDGGYVVVGYSNSTDSVWWENNGDYDSIILKYDAANKIEWSKNIGGSGFDSFNSVALTPDGGYIAVGDSTSDDAGWTNEGEFDMIMVKFDQSGETKWVKSIGTNREDISFAVEADRFGNIFIAGAFNVTTTYFGMNPSHLGGELRLIKFDESGDALWQKNYKDYAYEHVSNIILTEDNGFFTVGNVELADDALTKPIESPGSISKYDANGDLEWKNVDHGNNGTFKDMVVLENGNLVVVGSSGLPMIAQYDNLGNLIWHSFINKGAEDVNYNSFLEIYTSIVRRDDGGFIVSGHQHNLNLHLRQDNGEGSAILVEYSEDGEILSSRYFGDDTQYHADVFHGESFAKIVVLKDNDVLAVGISEAKQSTIWGNKGEFDGVIVRTREDLSVASNSSDLAISPGNPKTGNNFSVFAYLFLIISLLTVFFAKKQIFSKIRKV